MSDFKSLFKYYKSFKQSNGTELNEHAQGLIDLKCPNKFNDHIEKYELDLDYTAFDEINDLTLKRLLTNPRTWSPYSFKSLPGLIIISGILDGQQAINLYNLILHDLPFNNLSQLKSNIPLPPDDDVMMSNLRWITVGYHHNWNTKIYDADDKGEIPSLIYEMFTRLGQILRFDNFRPEAGIINYYTRKSVLSPHSDTSELNHDHPLFSLSLGCPSIFLVGGKNRDDVPVIPIYLQDSDLLVMSKESRLSYHAVPKILSNKQGIQRININIRQVYD